MIVVLLYTDTGTTSTVKYVHPELETIANAKIPAGMLYKSTRGGDVGSTFETVLLRYGTCGHENLYM